MNLLSSYQLGDITLKNRVVMSPMTRNRTPNEGIPNALNALYYEQRASAGLIVSEAVNISPQAVGSPWTPGIYTPEQIAGWQKITQAIHQQGGKIFVQLWHTGRVSHPVFQVAEALPVAPSAIAAQGKNFTHEGWKEYLTPRALDIEEIKNIVEDYRQAAINAQAAGFDGVELHGAFGYLPNQFLSDVSNLRTDEYGGSIENRCRFTLEIMRALIEVWGSQRVGIRIAPNNVFNSVLDSNPTALYGHLIQQLDTLNLAYLSVMNHRLPNHENPNVLANVTAFARGLFKNTLITNTGYTYETGNEAITEGHANLVAYGTLYIANPDLVERFAAQAPLNQGDKATYYGGSEKGYTDYERYHS